MQTKLTLRMDKRIVESGKRRAREQGKSLSQMIADYLRVLEQVAGAGKQELPEKTARLLGIAGGGSEEDYAEYRQEKYS